MKSLCSIYYSLGRYATQCLQYLTHYFVVLLLIFKLYVFAWRFLPETDERCEYWTMWILKCLWAQISCYLKAHRIISKRWRFEKHCSCDKHVSFQLYRAQPDGVTWKKWQLTTNTYKQTSSTFYTFNDVSLSRI